MFQSNAKKIMSCFQKILLSCCGPLPKPCENEILIEKDVFLRTTFMRSVVERPIYINPISPPEEEIKVEEEEVSTDETEQQNNDDEYNKEYQILHRKNDIISEIYFRFESILEEDDLSNKIDENRNSLEEISRNLTLNDPFFCDYDFLLKTPRKEKNKKEFYEEPQKILMEYKTLTSKQKEGLSLIRDSSNILNLKIFIKKLKEDTENETSDIKNDPIHQKMVPVVKVLNEILS